MKIIKRITDSDFYGGQPVYLESLSRLGARGVLIDDNQNVGMMFMSSLELYKLPGGGIENIETKEEAFLREILEETGYNAEIIEELGYIEEHKSKNNFLQGSYCFLAKAKGTQIKRKLTYNEKALGFEIHWLPLGEAISKMQDSLERTEEYTMKFMMLRDNVILEEATRLLKRTIG